MKSKYIYIYVAKALEEEDRHLQTSPKRKPRISMDPKADRIQDEEIRCLANCGKPKSRL